MAKKLFELMQADALNKEIKSIGIMGHRLNVRIQLAALNAIHYSIAHGDIGFGQRLVMALNNGQRKNSLVAFLEKFGKFEYNKEEKSLVFRKRDELKAEDATKIVEAIDLPWFEAIKAPEPKSMYDFDAAFEKFMKHAKAMADKKDMNFKGGEHMSKLLDYWNSLEVEEETSDEVSDTDVTNDGTFTEEEVAETAALMQAAIETTENNRQELRAA